MATPEFNTLSDERQHILQLAQERHNIEVIPLEELKGGRTGAVLYLVSVCSADSLQVKHYILKLDRIHKKAMMDEIKRHRLAWSQAPADFAQQHMAGLPFNEKREGQIAIFYTIAGQSLHHFRPLASFGRQNQLETIFCATNDNLLKQWNAEQTIEQVVHPQNVLDRWLGYRLKPEGNLRCFLEDVFHVPQDIQGLLIQGEVFPNPLAYGCKAELWGPIRPIDIIIGFQHGDLNIGNILVKFTEDEQELAGYFLIDFALYKSQMPLLYDQCYLEMSYLLRELERTSFSKWVSLVTRLAREGTPDPQKVPVELAGACAVINAGRKAFERWVEASHVSLRDDLQGQFWLAAVAAGLNYCNKVALPNKERLAGLIYAAAHLKRYFTQFGVPIPVEVRLLCDPSQLQEVDHSDDLGSDEALVTGEPPPWPTGTVTFLFTDMVGSTALWEAFPRAMPAALARHDALLEQSASNHGGFVFKRVGDGFCIAFQSAVDALNAAVDGQRVLQAETWARTGPLRVRMALHTGTASVTEGDYFGPTVNRVARLMSVTHGGQILLSENTLKLIQDQSSPEFAWLDLGQHWLRDLKQPEHIYQVVVPDFPADFPPLPTVGLQTRNLPEHATAFVGRQRELAQIARLLDTHRLVTLCGPGGIGKTRLALAVAEAQGDNYRQGVYFVPLLSLSSVTTIVPAIANELGLAFVEGRTPQAQLLDYLRPRQMLVVLDNMEHLFMGNGSNEATRKTLALVEAMLAAAPELKILVASRELLRLPQEQVCQIRGLPFGDEASITVAPHDDAVELFKLRSQRVLPAFERVSGEDLQHIRRLCRLVEGMPLAIELAAAQLRLLSLADIVAEIESNLDVLDSGLRGTGARHSSVRVIFENSWHRLKDGEKLILARLSVFQGGFTYQAASLVAKAAVKDLANLLDKSLIQRGADDRFVLHALIHMFAAEKLAQMPDELDQTQDHQFRYYKDLLGEAVSLWRSDYESTSLDVISPEVDNLHAGWNWILGQDDWDELAAYLDDLWQFFKVRGRLPEAMDLLDQVLQTGKSAEPAADFVYQAHWERLLGQAYLWMSQMGEGDKHFRQTLSLLGWPLPGSQASLLVGVLKELLVQAFHRAWPSHFLGRSGQKQAASREAFIAYERLAERAMVENDTLLAMYCSFRSLNLAEKAGLHRLMARAYASTGLAFSVIPLRRAAKAYISWAVAIAQQEPSPEVWEWVSRLSGFYFTFMGRWEIAEDHFIRGAKAAAELGRHWEQEFNWTGLLMVTYMTGEFDRGLKFARRIGVSARRRGDAGFEAAGLYWEAFFRLRLGDDVGLIVKLLEESASAPSEVMNVLDWLIVYSSLAQAYMRQGQDEEAIQEVNKATRLISEVAHPFNIGIFYGYADVASVYLTLWEKYIDGENRHALRRSARQACRDLNAYSRIFPAVKSLIWLYQGLFDWLDGRPQKAHKTWQKSLALAKELGTPYVLGRTHYEIGRHLSEGKTTETGWGRQEHLQRAAEIFAELGAKYDMDRVQAELGR